MLWFSFIKIKYYYSHKHYFISSTLLKEINKVKENELACNKVNVLGYSSFPMTNKTIHISLNSTNYDFQSEWIKGLNAKLIKSFFNI